MGWQRLIYTQIWEEYVKGKQTFAQLAEKFLCSIFMIQRRLDKVLVQTFKKEPMEVIVPMDTTSYFSFYDVVYKSAMFIFEIIENITNNKRCSVLTLAFLFIIGCYFLNQTKSEKLESKVLDHF